MDYKVLYRKYRPQTFDELVGQNVVVKLLKDSILENRISHAYIFSGPRGTGKTSTAKIFARAINCISNTDGNPCLECELCKNFSSSSDIYEIDAASNTGVDQIREIIDNVKLSPINSKYKVYIIDEVHMLSTSAFNALLLTLEEPPAHAIFILATTNIEDVPITVLSRCQRLDFKKIGLNDIIIQLKNISQKENIEIDDDAIVEIANFSEGGLRDALSILDQISKLKKHIEIKDVLDNLGLISNSQVIEMIDKLNNNETTYIVEFIEKAEELSVDYKTLIKKIINVIKKRALEIKMNDRIDRLSYDDYKNMCFELSDTLYKTNINVDLFSLLELILLKYIINDTNAEKPTCKQTNNMELTISKEKNNKLLTREKPKISQNKNKSSYYEQLEKVRINNCFVSASKENKNFCSNMWVNFKQITENKKVKGLIEDTDIVLASPSIMVLNTSIKSLASEINKNCKIVEDNFNNLFKTNYLIIATDTENWNNEMNIFKENMKNKIKYTLLNEPVENNEIDDIIDIFDINKVEEK